MGTRHVTRTLAVAKAAAATTDAGFAELVIALPLFGVGEHLVGPGNFLELALGLGVIRIGIGVQFAGALAICLFDFLSRSAA